MPRAVEDTATLCDAFAMTSAVHGAEPALRTADRTVALTWREYADRLRAAAAGLYGVGVGRGDTVALWLSNRPELHLADTAAMQLGAAPFLGRTRPSPPSRPSTSSATPAAACS
jgi:acyl-CoA synthetase (AMP-forming)/AMP-acid ligase II